MAHMTKKADFLSMLVNLTNPKLKTFRGSVYLSDEKQSYEIYKASNMEESGIISAMNQCQKYRKWMDENAKH